MKSLISGDKFVWKGESGHERTFFQPENGAKRTREENSLHCSKSNKPFLESLLFVHPLHCPLRFLFYHINVLDGIEQVKFLILVLDVCINQEGVGLGMDIFHGDLEAVEAASFRDLDLGAELLG